jgi:hypothetical protein
MGLDALTDTTPRVRYEHLLEEGRAHAVIVVRAATAEPNSQSVDLRVVPTARTFVETTGYIIMVAPGAFVAAMRRADLAGNLIADGSAE